ncbi:UNVERIFIED_CONTAM: hypothetical protein Sradi_5231000 [Sesamum radiatum]|uniref:Helitron helicase-like domain-containing protein n=1 Tax=Sesamum radiatum TaxID=300843 RepID=A0AAW2LKE0_SESRA
MFIYDTEHEIENRLLENNGLDRELIDKIKHILGAHNPFVQTLWQLAQRDDILDCKLLIKEKTTAHSRYALPTTSHVAGYYDPLQYPLLFSNGTYGWDSDCRTVDGNVGRRTVIPSSFVGSPRDMYQRYQDAMSVVQKFGKPDLFITMTCNPSWEEIQNELKPGQTPEDRFDLLTRIIRAKFEELKKDIYTKGVLGKVVAHVHVIKFKRRGLPDAHMLVILDKNDKLNTPDDHDHIV